MWLWLVIVLLLIFVIGVFGWIRLQGNVRLLSLRTDLKWQINKQDLVEVCDQVGVRDEIVWIVLMPGLEKYKQAAGFGINSEPIYYGEWRIVSGQTVLAVFVDINEWQKLKPGQGEKVLSLFIAQQMGEKFGRSVEEQRAGTGIAISQDKPMIKIIKRFQIKK